MDLPSSFINRWLKSTLYGWMLGFAVVILLALLFESIGLAGYQFFIGLGIGVGVGFMQGRALKNYFEVQNKWMWASIIGMGISFLVFDIGNKLNDTIPSYSLQLSVAVGGF